VIGRGQTIREDLDDPLPQESCCGEVGVGDRGCLEGEEVGVGDDLAAPEGSLVEREVLAESDKFGPLRGAHNRFAQERDRLLAEPEFGEPSGLGCAGLGAVAAELERAVEEGSVMLGRGALRTLHRPL
jgi:hypothetical protein